MTPEDQLRAAAATTPPPSSTSSEGARRVSVTRVAGILAVVAAAVLAYVDLTGSSTAAAPATASGFSPYVDVTATPLYAFESPAGAVGDDVVLGFVVSAADDACAPSWGAAYSLDEAADALDLDRRVARLQQLGGDVAVSFGGAANSELAIGCTDPTALAAAYAAVVDRYSADTIDLDVEGAPSSAAAVVARRAAAIATVQHDRPDDRPLDVWLTLPVGPAGLTSEGVAVLGAFLAADVRLAGVNAMVMDYGDSLPAGRSVAAQAKVSLVGLQRQLRAGYAAAGTELTAVQTWQLVGATPMIGANDTGEVFDLADARALVDFAREHHLRRISMWSANRDQDCGPNYPDVHVVSDQCSGVTQTAGGFAAIFRRFAATQDGAPLAPVASPAEAPTTSPAGTPGAPASPAADDPATSPYAIWDEDQAYAQGTKTVWHHNVYQAKWYSLGDRPDTPVTDTWMTSWTLLGPVMPGEHPVALPTEAPGTYPRWSARTAYVAGSRVLLHRVGYQAKWWTRGDVPDAVLASPYDSPWQLIKD